MTTRPKPPEQHRKSGSLLQTRVEVEGDKDEIRRLLGLGFDASHAKRNIWSLREGEPIAELCLVVEASGEDKASGQGRLDGSIRYWPIMIAGTPSLLLGPLAVDPQVRGQGKGRQLVTDSIEKARAMGHWRWCFVSGETDYYTRLGFTKVSAEDLDLPLPIEDERLHLLDFSATTLQNMPDRPWVIRPGGFRSS